MKKYVIALLLCTVQFSTFNSQFSTCLAQCPVENTAFQSGERLEYKLYFNWKFIWKNAGTASMSTRTTNYRGKAAYQTDLITTTSKHIDRFFMMRDTLRAIYTNQIVPLYYRKGATEGDKYRLNEITYNYSGGKTLLHQYYRHGNGNVTINDNTVSGCVHDMVSMVMRCRSYQASDFTIDQRVPFQFADGDKVKTETLIYRGIKKFKTEGENRKTYRCLVFSYLEKNSKGKEKEIVTFYITDDKNHIPVRLDLNLRFGTAKAYLKNATGLRNPETSLEQE